MPPAAAGAVIGAIVAVVLAVAAVDGEGSSSALIVPLYAIVIVPIGAGLGWGVGRIGRAIRNRKRGA